MDQNILGIGKKESRTDMGKSFFRMDSINKDILKIMCLIDKYKNNKFLNYLKKILIFLIYFLIN